MGPVLGDDSDADADGQPNGTAMGDDSDGHGEDGFVTVWIGFN